MKIQDFLIGPLAYSLGARIFEKHIGIYLRNTSLTNIQLRQNYLMIILIKCKKLKPLLNIQKK